MTPTAREIALTAENEALHLQIARLRAEDTPMRRAIVEVRHHLAAALRVLPANATDAREQIVLAVAALNLPHTTDRYGNGG
jgi:predicted metal-dependent phosphoesterase TrpH